MFCPKCSQQQIYEDIRFCSRCGFQLSVVKAILVADDSFPKMAGPVTVDRSRRKKDMIIGAVLMLPLALHTAWTTEDLSLDREYSSLIFKCFILCVLIKIIPAIRDFFSPKATGNNASSTNLFSRFTAKFNQQAPNHALPPADDSPGADYFAGRITNAELVPRPSITEHTTNLLRNN